MSSGRCLTERENNLQPRIMTLISFGDVDKGLCNIFGFFGKSGLIFSEHAFFCMSHSYVISKEKGVEKNK